MDWTVKWELGGERGLLTGGISDNLFLEKFYLRIRQI